MVSKTHTGPGDIPLLAVRAFVAVGRQGSFTRAGAALGVTQGAVSRHVATLEAFAGTRLFIRRGATSDFTPAGMQLYEALKDAMSTIEITMQLLVQKASQHDRLKVRTSMPSFAMTVVVPSLGAYSARHGVQIDLITSLAPPQPSDDFDVLITRDLSLAGTESWELAQEELVCVGSPSLVAAHHSRAKSAWPMVAARSRPEMLAVWAIAAGIPSDQLHVVATYDHLFLAVSAAVGGTGFLVTPKLLVLDQLSAGNLQLADQGAVSSGASYVAYVNSHSAHTQAAREFCRWLKGLLRERLSRK
ncbi:HTH-type transcriptional activator AmpR [Variovorax sp. PBS-H4]|nr:HTH-type transcriptional activator AmpR [Variovorax sp. PBS-H4]